jgi:hypothetical protein
MALGLSFTDFLLVMAITALILLYIEIRNE